MPILWQTLHVYFESIIIMKIDEHVSFNVLKNLWGWIASSKACGAALILPGIPRFPIYCFFVLKTSFIVMSYAVIKASVCFCMIVGH